MRDKYIKHLKKIKKNLGKINDSKTRKRAMLLMEVLESKKPIKHACAHYGVARSNIYRWLKILEQNDFDICALQEKSRRPRNCPNKTPAEVEQKVIKLRAKFPFKGGHFLARLLYQKHGIKLSHACVDKILKRYNQTKPRKKPRKNKHTKRYAVEKPLLRVQFDSVDLKICDSNGNRLYAITAIDDHSRLAFLYLCHSKGGLEAAEALEKFIRTIGRPCIIQHDNGSEFTARYTSLLNPRRKKEACRTGFEQLLDYYKIQQKFIPPATPQLNGKIERLHRTIRNEFDLDALDGLPFEEIEHALEEKMRWYNFARWHASLNYLTPYEVFSKHKKAA